MKATRLRLVKEPTTDLSFMASIYQSLLVLWPSLQGLITLLDSAAATGVLNSTWLQNSQYCRQTALLEQLAQAFKTS